MWLLMAELYTIYEDADQMYRIGKRPCCATPPAAERKKRLKNIKSTML